jgi:hypothetical protein
MARRRRNPKSNLTTIALLGGLGVVAYGSNFLGIKDAVAGGLGGGGGTSKCPMIAWGQPHARFVQADAGGTYSCIWEGAVVMSGVSREAAEAEYNRRCG